MEGSRQRCFTAQSPTASVPSLPPRPARRPLCHPEHGACDPKPVPFKLTCRAGRWWPQELSGRKLKLQAEWGSNSPSSGGQLGPNNSPTTGYCFKMSLFASSWCASRSVQIIAGGLQISIFMDHLLASLSRSESFCLHRTFCRVTGGIGGAACQCLGSEKIPREWRPRR